MAQMSRGGKFRTGVCFERSSYKFLALLQMAQPELDSISKVVNYVISEYAKVRTDIDTDVDIDVKMKTCYVPHLEEARKRNATPKHPVLSKKELEAKALENALVRIDMIEALENALVRIDKDNKRRMKRKERDMQKKNLGCSIEEYLFGD